MLNYSDDGLWVRRRFFAPYNDVSIIVEDMGKENFYNKLFQTLLRGEVKIDSVIGVGGKPEVIRRYEDADPTSVPPEFYLVDGDFDEVLNIVSPIGVNFYRLPRYDIENFLIEEGALSFIAEETAPNQSAQEYVQRLQFSVWIRRVVEASILLAAAAALWRELEIEDPKLPQSIERHSQQSGPGPDRYLIASYIDEFKKTQGEVDWAEFDQRLTDMITRMGNATEEHRRWISGKHILIPLAIKLLNQHTGGRYTKESICFRLALRCEFAELDDLRTRILSICQVRP